MNALHTFILILLFLTLFVFAHSFPTRRILHQPLFPASSYSPQPPPIADQPYSPNGSSSQTLPPPPKPTKEFTIAISVGVVALGMLSALAFFIYKHKVKPNSNHTPTKPPTFLQPSTRLFEAPNLISAAAEQDPVTVVVPNSNGKQLNSVKKSDRYRPSPDLQPLPPLRSRAVAPDEVSSPGDSPTATAALSSEDESVVFYTPQGSVASSDDGFSTPVSRLGDRTRNVGGAQRSRLSSAPSPDVFKHAIITIPSIKTTPPPPPPPPPPMENKSRQVPPPPPPPPPVKTTWSSVSSESKAENKSEHNEEIEDGCNPSERTDGDEDMDGERPKLKPLHWDKVQATSDRATVWDQLKSSSSSFQLNEDMMESLFGCNSANSNGSDSKDSATRRSVLPPVEQQNRVLDPKKSQNIAILLRALNVTRDQVSEALLNGNPEALGAELLETLVKMAPTKEEEIKLKDYKGDSSKLGSAEKFLKAILDIPFAFRRVEAMLYRANFDAEVMYLSKSFVTLETASGELKNSRLFLKLLEAVLRTGNRMNVGTNRGDAKAFKLDTLLKLVDIKGTDGKTTLLHFVVQEIIRSEGTGSEAETQTSSRGKESEFRRQGLQMVSGLSRELGSVKLAAGMDSDVLHGYVLKLETGLEKVRAVLKLERPDMEGGFFESMKAFLGKAEEEIFRIKNDERKALTLVREVTEYFHGNAAKEEAHPFRIFMIVRDFLSTLDHVCKDVGRMQDRTVMGAARTFHISANALLPVLNRYNGSRGGNSSEESSSP